MSREQQPTWPTPVYATREEAIAAAVASVEDGDAEVTVHQGTCAMRFDSECDCEPEVRVIREGLA